MTRALILTAGLGKRTGLKKTPKCMQKVHGKPILEHLVNKLNKAGVNEIIINVHKDYEKIFNYFGTRLLYLYEPTLLGEHGTEELLQDWLGDQYIVMNGDTLNNLNLGKLIEASLDGDGGNVIFIKEKYGGTKIVDRTTKVVYNYKDGQYWDCGTPAKLAKCRREYK